MIRWTAALLVIAAMGGAPTTALAAPDIGEQPSPRTVADDLIAADRAIGSDARGEGLAAALSKALDDDVVLFAVPIPGLARGRPAAQAVLGRAFEGTETAVTWTMIRAGISGNGAHGFTYGFVDREVSEKPKLLGKYVAYWIRRGGDWRGGDWRVAAFKYVPRPDGEVSSKVRDPALPGRLVPVTADPQAIARFKAEVDRVERQFSADAQVIGLGAAFRKYGSPDAMNVGGGADFTYGNDAIAEAQGGDAPSPSPLRWTPDGVLAASSGDLGLTFGYLERNGPTPPGRLARIPWFTIWRRSSPDAPWLYVAE